MGPAGYVTQLFTALESLRSFSAWDLGLRGYGAYGWWGCPFGYSGYGWLGMISYYAFWVLVIVAFTPLLKLIFSSRNNQGPAGTDSSQALEILKRRYAKGEIPDEVYQRMKAALG